MTTRIIQGQVVVLDYIFKISKLEIGSMFRNDSMPFFGSPKLMPNKQLINCSFRIYCVDKSEHTISYEYDDILDIETPINAYLIKLKECTSLNVPYVEIVEMTKSYVSDIENHVIDFGNSKIKEITDIMANIKPLKTL